MATPSTFLQLTNKVLGPFNEVQLTSSTFTSAQGFQAECQNYINQAIFDICTYEDTKWPFLWSTTTFNTVAGQTDYIRTDSFNSLNWETFRQMRFVYPTSDIASITCNLTTKIATFTTLNPHLLITGDIINIFGATDVGYNATGAVTVLNSTQFTMAVSATTTPASGPIVIYCENIIQHKLQIKDWLQYIDQFYWDKDQNTDPTGWGVPKFIVRKPDDNFYIGGPPCNRPYIIYYEGYTIPNYLIAYSDTSLIPYPYEQVIIDKALHYANLFRSDVTEAELCLQRYEANIVNMRRILIPQATFCNMSD